MSVFFSPKRIKFVNEISLPVNDKVCSGVSYICQCFERGQGKVILSATYVLLIKIQNRKPAKIQTEWEKLADKRNSINIISPLSPFLPPSVYWEDKKKYQ